MRQLHRTASNIAGVYTLIQALLYTVFAIYGCAIFTCLAQFPFPIDGNHKSSMLLYLAYFKGKCSESSGPYQGEAASALRTYYVLIAYGIVSAVWIPTSTLLIVAAVSRVKGSHGAWLYYPWIFNTIILVIMDVAATIWYGIDIDKTLTTSSYEKFVGSNVGPIPKDTDGITLVPSAIMTGVFFRGIILWLLNVILLGVVIQAAREVRKSFSTSEFIRGSAPKKVQKLIEQEREVSQPKPEEHEVRWVRVKDEVTLPRLELLPSTSDRVEPPAPPRVPERTGDFPTSPQSPIADSPSPVVKRRPSLRRTGSSPVFDFNGVPTGESFPFQQDPNRRYVVSNPPPQPRYQPPSRHDWEREMERERQMERETDRELARLREMEREKQDKEFQRLRGGEHQPEDLSSRPWMYVRPSDLKLQPKYDQTMKHKFAPEVPPKPAIPAPDYSTPPRTRWDPTNLSRSGSRAGDSRYNDQRWNPNRAY